MVGVCGCSCSECRVYKVSCEGCYAIKGKASWLHQVKLDICDFYDCAVNIKNITHCGQCDLIPCKKFFANKHPNSSEEEHLRIVSHRVELLTNLETNQQ